MRPRCRVAEAEDGYGIAGESFHTTDRTLITGPPCAGKTTLAQRLAQPGDLILDFDTIAIQLGSDRRWHHNPQITELAEQHMRLAMRQLQGSNHTAWVIRCLPDPVRRARLARALSATVWVLNPGQAECRQRAQQDGRPVGTLTAIRWWYRNYRASEVDTPWPQPCKPAL